MKRLFLSIALLALAGYVNLSCGSPAYQGGEPELLSTTLTEAQANGKPILLDVFATW